ncbi:MAG: hypothetical protein ACK4WH_09060 [Phycisphaerales bacterium]
MSALDQPVPASVAEQARLELTLAAAGAERANRPRILIVGAWVLLAIAAIYAISGVTARSAAMSRVASARQQAAKTIQLVNEVKDLRSKLSSRGVDYNPQMAVFLDQLARDNQAQPVTAISEVGTGDTVATMQQRRYRASFADQDPVHLLSFLNATQESPLTAGIEITRIEVKPGTPDEVTGQVRWRLDADFARWERKR